MTPTELNKKIGEQIVGQGNQVRASVLVEVLKSLVNSKVTDGAPNAFNKATAYSSGDLVEKDEKWYKFNKNHTGDWVDADVDEVTMYDLYVALEARVKALET